MAAGVLPIVCAVLLVGLLVRCVLRDGGASGLTCCGQVLGRTLPMAATGSSSGSERARRASATCPRPISAAALQEMPS